MTLALLDIDDFKFENDRHGHQHGDRLLCELSALLRESRVGDRAFRLGGDEFALLLAHTDEAGRTSRSVASAARSSAACRASRPASGSARPPPEDREPSTLWGRADAALLEAKRRGGNAIVAAAEVVDSVPVVTIEKVRAVRALIDAGAVDVAFQPIWDLSGTRVLGYEALARPRSSELSGPGEAFEIADSIGRGHELDAVCRRATLRVAGDLPPGALLFLNVSPQSLEHDALAGDSLVRRRTIEPGRSRWGDEVERGEAGRDRDRQGHDDEGRLDGDLYRRLRGRHAAGRRRTAASATRPRAAGTTTPREEDLSEDDDEEAPAEDDTGDEEPEEDAKDSEGDERRTQRKLRRPRRGSRAEASR